MKNMTRGDWGWFVTIALIAVAVNPFLKSIGLLPADVFRSLGIFFPGLPQIVFGPFMAALTLLCFIKTGQPLVFPVIGVLRALSLAFIFPRNPEHLGVCLAGIVAGFAAWAMLRNASQVRFSVWLPGLSGLYAGLYAAGNYATTLWFGPAPQTQVILDHMHVSVGIVLGALIIGGLLGLLTYAAMKLLAALMPDRTIVSPQLQTAH
jgi:hypothetical protein